MKLPRHPRRPSALVCALHLNAALLLAILIAVLTRGSGVGPGGAAYGALPMKPTMQPIAGGGGVFLMPAQFSRDVWGFYIMDIDTQNVCAYEYVPSTVPGTKPQVRFVASRNYRQDTRMREWNTSPPTADIGRLNQLDRGAIRGE